MQMQTTPEKVVAVALSCVGYLEKKSNHQLDDFAANAGSGNFTKFARDLDAIPDFYNGKKNGFPWCDVFLDWLFVAAFGAEAAKKLLCQPERSLGAGCGYSARYYQEKGQFHQTPAVGDQVFFFDSVGDIAHTGLVYQVDDRYVYTVEGNTSPADGVVTNGGGVHKKQYALTHSRIYGYGRPEYAKVFYDGQEEPKRTSQGVFILEMRVLQNGSKGDDVQAMQMLLIAKGYSCGVWGADGNFGSATEQAVTQYQKKKNLQVDGKTGPQTWGSLLGVG